MWLEEFWKFLTLSAGTERINAYCETLCWLRFSQCDQTPNRNNLMGESLTWLGVSDPSVSGHLAPCAWEYVVEVLTAWWIVSKRGTRRDQAARHP